MANIGDVYSVRVYFEDKNEYKERPVIIINKTIRNFNEIIYTISEITSKKPKEPPSYYDNFKEPIKQWWKCGLNKESYVKTNKLYNIKSNKLHKRIGHINNKSSDFNRIVNRIIEVNF
ncbi:TPA: type II toxin-antitoxin system PemK/MazF family toxin [Clostridium botulinum]|nr:type II toxin-antitoxin system PemK/MazF family toxin [Clostridium botulinum]